MSNSEIQTSFDYNLSTKISYWLVCEGCSGKTPEFTDDDFLVRQAHEWGWVDVDTPDDGTLNFCKACAKDNNYHQNEFATANPRQSDPAGG